MRKNGRYCKHGHRKIYKSNRCRECHEEMIALTRVRFDERKALGFCIQCGKNPIYKGSLCKEHYIISYNRTKARRALMRSVK